MAKEHEELEIWAQVLYPALWNRLCYKKSGEFDAGGEAMLHEDKRTSSQAQAEEKSGIYGIVKT